MPGSKRDDRKIPGLDRLIIWCTFKPIFFKHLLNISLPGEGRN
jgi:hypothetical protein